MTGVGAVSSALFRLDGDVAIVTGAGSGLGHAIAVMLADAGARVVAADMNAQLAQRTAAIIAENGGTALPVTADVSDPASVAAMIDVVIAQFGRLDILVNNAGIYPPVPRLPDIDWQAYEKTFAVNVFGVMRCISEAARHMRPGGRIINMSSMESIRPSGPSTAHYNTTKSAVNGLTRASAVDLAPLGIRVNAILPGLIKTEGTARMPQEMLDGIAAHAPSGRVGEPQDIASAALFLASPASSYVNGHCLVVDGGTTIKG